MISRFFIDRPIFASVLSIVIVLVGVVAYLLLPVAQYPEVAPPTVQVTATYPGANAKTVADTVATPIEQEVNGVERMLYMSSKCTNDGQMTLDVTFELGTNLDTAQVLVQNRVAVAEAKLPEEVKRIGVTTKKKSPSILMCVNLISLKRPDGGYYYDQIYLSNFATLNVKDDLARIKGVGDVTFLGPRDYSMRVWLDPDKLAGKQMTAGDVINAIREQNRQVAAGRLGQPPVPSTSPIQFQLPLNASERLTSEDQFRDIIVRTGSQGGVVHLQDLVIDDVKNKDGRVVHKGVELGAKNYDVNSYLDGDPSATLAIFQLPGSNAVKTAEAIKAKMEELKGRFPEGVDYRIHYDTTVFIEESIASVIHTLIEAFVLVFIVVLVFLQNWRATIVPMVAVPVSLIGTFAIMTMLGFSLNNLSLFGLVLAIGIVVDDAIVVVENVERWMAQGLPPKEASRKAMEEVTGPVIAISLVLCAVFVPTAFMAGISGQFYRQFALTIAASTVISAFNSLTLSPALCGILLKPHAHGQNGQSHQEALPRLGVVLIGGLIAYEFLLGPVAHLFHIEVGGHGGHEATEHAALLWGLQAGLFAVGCLVGWLVAGLVNWLLGRFFVLFNKFFDVTIRGYGAMVALLLRLSVVALAVYAGLMVLTYAGFKAVPVGFIPEQDKGYLVVNVQLPDGATLDRTDRFMHDLAVEVRKDPGVYHTIEVPGYSILLSSNISNVGGMFVLLKPFEERAGVADLSAPAVIKRLREKFAAYRDAKLAVFGAPPVDGLGSTGGFKLQVQDRRGAGLTALQGATALVAEQGNADPKLQGLFTSFSVNQPQLRIEVDEEKAKTQRVALSDIDQALQANLGSFYVNDFFFQNRNWQVNVQAGPAYPQPGRRHRQPGGPQRQGRPGAAAHPGQGGLRQRPADRQPLQHVPVRRDQRRHGPRRIVRPGHSNHGRSDGGLPALDDGLGMDGVDLPANPGRQGPAHEAGLPAGGGLRVPRAGGAVRELVAAAVDHPHRAHVPSGRHRRRLADGHGKQHLHADRPRRADRPGRQKRDPDCGVCQAVAGPGQGPLRGHGRGGQAAPAADPDDVLRVHSRRRAAGAGHGGGGRDARGAGRGGLQRHAGRDDIRYLLHAGVLRRRPLVHGAEGAAARGPGPP